jgi:hypothetical protein
MGDNNSDDRPKKPLTTYFRFKAQIQNDLKSKNVPHDEIKKILKDKWEKMP